MAVSCGVGHRRGLDPVLRWLWHRPAATAPTESLAWEPRHGVGVALKIDKKMKERRKEGKKEGRKEGRKERERERERKKETKKEREKERKKEKRKRKNLDLDTEIY